MTYRSVWRGLTVLIVCQNAERATRSARGVV